MQDNITNNSESHSEYAFNLIQNIWPWRRRFLWGILRIVHGILWRSCVQNFTAPHAEFSLVNCTVLSRHNRAGGMPSRGDDDMVIATPFIMRSYCEITGDGWCTRRGGKLCSHHVLLIEVIGNLPYPMHKGHEKCLRYKGRMIRSRNLQAIREV